jgi:hypothetical protein
VLASGLNSANETASSAQSTAESAQSTAESAQTAANSKNQVFFQSTKPGTTGRKVNDIWFNTSEDNALYYWNGSAWTKKTFASGAIDVESIFAQDIVASGTITGVQLIGGTGNFQGDIVCEGALVLFQKEYNKTFKAIEVNYITEDPQILFNDIYGDKYMYWSAQKGVQFPNGIYKVETRKGANLDTLKDDVDDIGTIRVRSYTLASKKSVKLSQATSVIARGLLISSGVQAATKSASIYYLSSSTTSANSALTEILSASGLSITKAVGAVTVENTTNYNAYLYAVSFAGEVQFEAV